MKALVIFNVKENKYIILRNAERCSKGNMTKLLMTAANEAWRDDEEIRNHHKNYAEYISFFMNLSPFFNVTKVDIHFNKEFGKWHIENRNWIGNYLEDQIIWADEEENYRPFAPMD